MYLLILLLGILAWLLGSAAVTWPRRPMLGLLSFSCCGLSLLLILWEVRRRVQAEDFSALMDTVPALALCAAILLTGTILLNLTALLRRDRL